MIEWTEVSDLIDECAKSWPERPKLDVSEWPFTRSGLERHIGKAMDLYGSLIERGRDTSELTGWERCPKRHGQAAHLLDCPPDIEGA